MVIWHRHRFALAYRFRFALRFSSATARRDFARIKLLALRAAMRIQPIRHELQMFLKNDAHLLDSLLNVLKCGPAVPIPLHILTLKTLKTMVQGSAVVRNRLNDLGACARGGLLPSLMNQVVADALRLSASPHTLYGPAIKDITFLAAALFPLVSEMLSAGLTGARCLSATDIMALMLRLIAPAVTTAPAKTSSSSPALAPIPSTTTTTSSSSSFSLSVPPLQLSASATAATSSSSFTSVPSVDAMVAAGPPLQLLTLGLTLAMRIQQNHPSGRTAFHELNGLDALMDRCHAMMSAWPHGPALHPWLWAASIDDAFAPIAMNRVRHFVVLLLGMLTLATGRQARGAIRFKGMFDGSVTYTLNSVLTNAAAATPAATSSPLLAFPVILRQQPMNANASASKQVAVSVATSPSSSARTTTLYASPAAAQLTLAPLGVFGLGIFGGSGGGASTVLSATPSASPFTGPDSTLSSVGGAVPHAIATSMEVDEDSYVDGATSAAVVTAAPMSDTTSLPPGKVIVPENALTTTAFFSACQLIVNLMQVCTLHVFACMCVCHLRLLIIEYPVIHLVFAPLGCLRGLVCRSIRHC